MNEDKAPFCPVSYSQEPSNPRGTAPLRLPSIPIATDLPSLIRSVNITRDILRSLTTSLTVNNFYGGRVVPAKQYGRKDYLMSDYESDWYQSKLETKEGVVYNKKDSEQRACINRIDAVEFRNNARDNDQSFFWRYPKPLPQGEMGDTFEEDFFERVIDVKWKKEQPVTVEFTWSFRILTPFYWTPFSNEDFFCVPWTTAPPDISFLTHAEDSCSWSLEKFNLQPQDLPKGVVLMGAPTHSGDGHSAECVISSIAYTNLHDTDQQINSNGAPTLAIPIVGHERYPYDCWGNPEYPPPPLDAYWSARCRPAKSNPITAWPQIGTINVDATGISATRDGKPLRKLFTSIVASPVFGGGGVRVAFTDADEG